MLVRRATLFHQLLQVSHLHIATGITAAAVCQRYQRSSRPQMLPSALQHCSTRMC